MTRGQDHVSQGRLRPASIFNKQPDVRGRNKPGRNGRQLPAAYFVAGGFSPAGGVSGVPAGAASLPAAGV